MSGQPGHHHRRLTVPFEPTPQTYAVFHQNKRQGDPHSELSLSLAFVCQRELFGHAYRRLQDDYFYDMPLDSGVAISVALPTRLLRLGIERPGDIDLMIVPYHGADLILDRALAVEVKVIRASYLRQDKSPNEFGFSQASALQALGFPYVAVVHLIVSDEAPEHAWEWTGIARVLDAHGRVEMLPQERHNLLPAALIRRSYGRLISNVPSEDIGLASVYIDEPVLTPEGIYAHGAYVWMPSGRPAKRNSKYDAALMERVADLLVSNRKNLVITPRHDPPKIQTSVSNEPPTDQSDAVAADSIVQRLPGTD